METEYDEKREVTERLVKLQKLLREASELAGSTAAGYIREPSALYEFLDSVVYECNWAEQRIPDRYEKYYGEPFPEES